VRLEQTEVDDLPLPTAGIAPVERDHRREGAHQAGDAVGEPEGRQRWRAVRRSRDVREAAERLGERAEARFLALRAGLAEAGDAHDHEAGIDLVQQLGAETPALEPTRPEVLDEHVGPVAEPPHDRAIGLVVEIERRDALVAADRLH
jgi:hypothetical protein